MLLGYFSKSSEVTRIQYVTMKLVHTLRSTIFYGYVTQSLVYEGRTLIALSYMLGRVPFIVFVSRDCEAEKVRVELYHA